MSTKSSLGYLKQKKTKQYSLHVYRELMDDKYYVEDDEHCFEVSRDVAVLIGEVLTVLENPQLAEKMNNLKALLDGKYKLEEKV